PQQGFLSEVLAIARGIATTAPLASRSTTLALRDGHRGLDVALQAEALAQAVTLTTADLREGLQAVRERRDPAFGGS
ncbi:enoyl-CoA hydratase, partial [Staphylococcus aureus]